MQMDPSTSDSAIALAEAVAVHGQTSRSHPLQAPTVKPMKTAKLKKGHRSTACAGLPTSSNLEYVAIPASTCSNAAYWFTCVRSVSSDEVVTVGNCGSNRDESMPGQIALDTSSNRPARNTIKPLLRKPPQPASQPARPPTRPTYMWACLCWRVPFLGGVEGTKTRTSIEYTQILILRAPPIPHISPPPWSSTAAGRDAAGPRRPPSTPPGCHS